MGRSSLRHGRELYGKDSANDMSVPGTGGGYGGGALRPAPDGISGLPSAWPAPTDLLVVSSGATTASVSWTDSVDPGDGSTVFGKLLYRDGVLVFNANLTSPQPDTGPLVDGRTYRYTLHVWDDYGRVSAPAVYEYTHTAT